MTGFRNEKKERYFNSVEFQVMGDYALFSDPITHTGGEKCTYQIPTYEAIKGILESIIWKPTIQWVVDQVRVMNPIQVEMKGVRTIYYNEKKSDVRRYTYLKDCCYQVRAHFEFNEDRKDLIDDWNDDKYYKMALRAIENGGRRDVYLGTRECQGYVVPCRFGEGKGAYDKTGKLSFGIMYNGIIYDNELTNKAEKPKTQVKSMTVSFWDAKMEDGIIKFIQPSECKYKKTLKKKENTAEVNERG